MIAAGAPEEKAKAAAAAIPVVGDLAAKDDIGSVKVELAEVNVRMTHEFKTLYRNLRLPAVGIVSLAAALVKPIP